MRSDLYHCGAVKFADVRYWYLPIEGSRNPTRSARPAVSVRFSVRPIDITLLERDGGESSNLCASLTLSSAALQFAR
jgi:hypothetical protein